MQFFFKYDLQKDTENFLKSFTSVNNKKPTKLQELYKVELGELDPLKVPEFLQKQVSDISEKLENIKSAWEAIEYKILERMEKIFSVSLRNNITVYLSTNSRCTYSIEENYFFVYMDSKNPNIIITHELIHFYTRHAFFKELKEKGVSAEKYNDIKESLTELINTDFQDLLGVNQDKGYSQHTEIRSKINQLRIEGRSVIDIINKL